MTPLFVLQDPSNPVLFTRRDHLFAQVVDSYDKAAVLLFAMLRHCVVLNEVRMKQFFLSPAFDDLLRKYGHKVYIEGALVLDISDARPLANDFLKSFAKVGAVHLQNATLRREQVDDAFLRHCVEVWSGSYDRFASASTLKLYLDREFESGLFKQGR